MFEVYVNDCHHLALLEQMIIALCKPKYNITANGISLKTKEWLEAEIDKSQTKVRENWTKEEQDNL